MFGVLGSWFEVQRSGFKVLSSKRAVRSSERRTPNAEP